MAWWPWGRAAEQPPAAPSAPLPAQVVGRPEPRRDWAGLAPVQRTLDAPLAPVAPLDAFRAGLVTSRDPSFLAPLTHQVDPSAGGLVEGLATHVPGRPQPYASDQELAVPARPAAKPAVQRLATTWSWWPEAEPEPHEAGDGAVEPSVTLEAPPLEASPVEAPTPLEASSVEGPPPLETSPAEASPAEASPLETSPAEASPLEASGVRDEVEPVVVPPSVRAAAPPAPAVPDVGVPASPWQPRTLAAAPMPPVQRASVADLPASVLPVVPASAPPLRPAVQRLVAGPSDTASAPPLRPAVQRPVAGPSAPATTAAAGSPAAGVGVGAAPSGSLPVPPPPSELPDLVPLPPVSDEPEALGPASAPLSGFASAITALGSEAEPSADPAPEAQSELPAVVANGSSPPALQRAVAPAPGSPPVTVPDVLVARTTSVPSVPRSTASTPAHAAASTLATPTFATPTLSAPTLGAPARPALRGGFEEAGFSETALTTTATGGDDMVWTKAGYSPLSSARSQPIGPGPLQRVVADRPPAPPAVLRPGAAVAGSGAPSVATGRTASFAQMFPPASTGTPKGFTTVPLQRRVDVEELVVEPQPTPPAVAEPVTPEPVTPDPVASEPAAAEPSGGQATAGPGAAAGTAAASGSGGSAVDLEEMARRLYEPLSARLRAELWLDRERAGL